MTKFCKSVLTLLLSSAALTNAQTCSGPDPLEYHAEKGFRVEKVGSVPITTDAAFSYNMYPADNFDGNIMYFLNQKEGIIFAYDYDTSMVSSVFNMATSPIPDGLDLSWGYSTFGSSGATYKVKAMSQGPTSDSVIIVFTSATLPTGWSEADGKLPAPGAFGKSICDNANMTGNPYYWVDDVYRPGMLPACVNNFGGADTFVAYDVFYKYTTQNSGELSNPVPFFTAETTVVPGHLGGGIATLPDGNILWSPGDCTVFGMDGLYAPQMNSQWCGKIHLIDTSKTGMHTMVLKGVRNSQQMRVYNKYSKEKAIVGDKKNTKKFKVAFMDIGGVTAEEVNVIKLKDVLKEKAHNFGWGRNMKDGKAREGTFYISAGIGGVLAEPLCTADAPIDEPGYIQPWIQFGRTATDFFYGISSLAIPSKGVDTVNLMWTEFNTGIIMGTPFEKNDNAGPEPSFKYRLFYSNSTEISSMNHFVQVELGDVGFYRGDSRLFHYPDGSPGCFMERTGVFYKLTEIPIPTQK